MIEGKVEILLGKGSGASVRHRRTADISPLLEGRTPTEAVSRIASVYGICANAQAHAATLALEACLGIESNTRTAAARALLTAMEGLRETLYRIALEWPKLSGRQVDGASVRPAASYVARLRQALFGACDPFAIGGDCAPDHASARTVIEEAEALLARTVFGEPLEVWRDRKTPADVEDWHRRHDTAAASMIAGLAKKKWLHVADDGCNGRALDGSDAIRLITQENDPVGLSSECDLPETTPFSRQRGESPLTALGHAGLGARFMARLSELARLPSEMLLLLEGEGVPRTMTALEADTGIGVVDAARGLLIHAARLDSGRVAGYRIVSPTDWNFSPTGVAARCLESITVPNEADRLALAHLVVNAIDPCVAYEVRAA